MIRVQDLRLYWRGSEWFVDAPTALSAAQIARVTAWALPRQIDRWRGLPPGEKKDECAHTIEALKAGRVSCRVTGTNDGAIFASTERTRPDRTFFTYKGVK